MGGADEPGVLGKDAVGVARFGRGPLRQPGFDFFGGQIKGELAFLRIDGDWIAAADDSNRAPYIRFWRDVSDDKSMATPRESAVRDEGDIFSQTFAHDR